MFYAAAKQVEHWFVILQYNTDAELENNLPWSLDENRSYLLTSTRSSIIQLDSEHHCGHVHEQAIQPNKKTHESEWIQINSKMLGHSVAPINFSTLVAHYLKWLSWAFHLLSYLHFSLANWYPKRNANDRTTIKKQHLNPTLSINCISIHKLL
jgi:hypothetical protein